jgi:hypothetical protein
MKNVFIFVAMLGMICFLSASALAADVVMTANDSNGATTSFNGDVGHWNPAGAPVAGKTYSTVGYLLRTPTTAGNYTFAGDSLTVGGGDGGGANPFLTNGSVNNNSLIDKTPSSPTITVNNLILDAGYIRDGMGSSDVWTLAGNISVTSNGGGLAAQCTFNVNSAISGSGTLYVADNGSGEASRTIYINSGSNTYDGSISLLGSSDARCRLTFADDSLMNFTIGASGVNNKISGTGTLTLNGDFAIDLSGAGTNIGDSWTLASATAQTFGDTFTVVGFTAINATEWDKVISPTLTYRFDESTGTLTAVVPEPATVILVLMGLVSLGIFWLRRK